MSSAGDRSSRIRRRQPDDGGDSQRADSDRADASAARAEPKEPSANYTPQQAQSSADGGVQPLPEQLSQRTRPRLSSQIGHLDAPSRSHQPSAGHCSLVRPAMSRPATRSMTRSRKHDEGEADDHDSEDQSVAAAASSPNALAGQSAAAEGSQAATAASAAAAKPVPTSTADPPLLELEILGGCNPALLASPALQGLQTLKLPFGPSQSVLQLLPTLPQLHTLEFREPIGQVDWSWLRDMPLLTDLHFTRFPSTTPPLDGIGQCKHLQSLHLCHTHFAAGTWARFCSTPAMRRLRHLEMERCSAADSGPSADEWRDGFSQLAQLESLRLSEVHLIDRLLQPLAHAHAPALRTLTIKCASTDDPYWATLPSAAALQHLLAAIPQLQIHLPMAATLDAWRDQSGWKIASSYKREAIDRQWHALQRMAAEMERVTVINQ